MNIDRRVRQLEHKVNTPGGVPDWAYRCAFHHREVDLSTWQTSARIANRANKILREHGLPTGPVPEPPQFPDPEVDAREIYEKYGTEEAYNQRSLEPNPELIARVDEIMAGGINGL